MVHDQSSVDVSLEPLDEYLVVQPLSDETETRAGLILPASAAAAAVCRTGIVTAIGADVQGVEPGEKVLYPREAGFEIRLQGIEVQVAQARRSHRAHPRLSGWKASPSSGGRSPAASSRRPTPDTTPRGAATTR